MVSPDRSPVQPTLKTVATVCRFPVLKVAMIRGLPHPALKPAPTRPAQKRDYVTHQLVNLRASAGRQIGDHRSGC